MGLIIKNGVIYNGAESEPVVYSLEEREIGVWTDGKPLYQKTVLIDNISSSTGIQRFAHGISNIETVITTNGTWINKSDNTVYIGSRDIVRPDDSSSSAGAWADATNIVISTGANRSNQNLYITFQYTKTTDTPGSGTWTPSGAKAEHYSTNEHVVGTWIDGSTVYEKSITINNTSTAYTSVTLDINGAETVWIYDGFAFKLPYSSPISGYVSSPSPEEFCGSIDINSNIVTFIYRVGNNLSGGTGYITVRYTKTTS